MNDNGQLKVAKIEDHRPATAATHTITYTLDGFQITSVIETTTPIRQIVDRLKQIGAEPPTAAKPEPTKQSGTPTCPVHNSQMKEGRRGFYCPKKVGDGYCKETAQA